MSPHIKDTKFSNAEYLRHLDGCKCIQCFLSDHQHSATNKGAILVSERVVSMFSVTTNN